MDLNSNGKAQSGQNADQQSDELGPNQVQTGMTDNFEDSDFSGADKNVLKFTEGPLDRQAVREDTEPPYWFHKTHTPEKQISDRIDLRPSSDGSVPGTANDRETSIEKSEVNNYSAKDFFALDKNRLGPSLEESIKNSAVLQQHSASTTEYLTSRERDWNGNSFANKEINPPQEFSGFRDDNQHESFKKSVENSPVWQRSISTVDDDKELSEIGEYTWTETTPSQYYPQTIFFEETVITYFPERGLCSNNLTEYDSSALDTDSRRSLSGDQFCHKVNAGDVFNDSNRAARGTTSVNGHSSSPLWHSDVKFTLHSKADEIKTYDSGIEIYQPTLSAYDNITKASLPQHPVPDFEHLVVYGTEKGAGGEELHASETRRNDLPEYRRNASGNDWSDVETWKDGNSSELKDAKLIPPYGEYPPLARRQTYTTHPRYTADNTQSISGPNSIAFIDSIKDSSRQKVISYQNADSRLEQNSQEPIGPRN